MNRCTHPRAIDGLDAAWCPDCQQAFPSVPSLHQQLKNSALNEVRKLRSRKSIPSVPLESGEPALSIPSVFPEGKVWMKTRTYRSRGALYYKFAWGIGSAIKQNIHIPGGCIDSPISTARREMVNHWIELGHSPGQIIGAIAKWRRKPTLH